MVTPPPPPLIISSIGNMQLTSIIGQMEDYTLLCDIQPGYNCIGMGPVVDGPGGFLPQTLWTSGEMGVL